MHGNDRGQFFDDPIEIFNFSLKSGASNMVLKQYLPPPPNKIMFFCVLGDVGNLKKTREKSKGGDFAPNQKNVYIP